jgi:hypothetical protein
MPHVQFNGSETPDSIPLAPAGVPLTFQIESVEQKEARSGKAMLEVKCKIQDPAAGPANGDFVFDYFVEPGSNLKTQVALKRLAKAVGVEIGAEGLDTEKLIGLSGKLVLKVDNYQGKEGRKLQEYLVA